MNDVVPPILPQNNGGEWDSMLDDDTKSNVYHLYFKLNWLMLDWYCWIKYDKERIVTKDWWYKWS